MKTHLNLQDADAFYEQLLNAHLGLSREASELLNARLILVMANQLGEMALLQACLDAAKAPEAGAVMTTAGPVE